MVWGVGVEVRDGVRYGDRGKGWCGCVVCIPMAVPWCVVAEAVMFVPKVPDSTLAQMVTY